MKYLILLATGLAATLLMSGCESIPPGAERGPHGTMAYVVPIEATPPGAKIEVNGEIVGQTPLNLKIFGDPDGTFHDFGSYYYVIRALPVTTNQFVQTRVFRTGHLLTPEDRIPSRVYFDMNQNIPPYLPPGGYEGYYGPPVVVEPYWGPTFHFYYGPRWHRRW
jgi:PEGA domain